MNTIYEGLLAQEPTSDAIYSMFREPLSYGALTRQIQRTASFLRSCGLGRGDRVGIVLPNGPEMGTAFLSIASC